jgi:uncharacterized protein (TIGR01777 family)
LTLSFAITGASGMLGRALIPGIIAAGHAVTRLVRTSPGAGEAHWDPIAGRIDTGALEGVDVVVHLAGENIGDSRWTPERKRRIRESRVQGTAFLSGTLAGLRRKPSLLISVSAVGFYGDRGDAPLAETEPPGTGFLAELGRDWEGATGTASRAGIRVVLPRFGVVLTPAGGALRKMLPIFRLGIAGPLGSGKQWMSWISLDDAVGVFHHLLHHADLSGPVNAVAPEPVTNAEFTRSLARVLGRPAIMPVPAIALDLLYGEMGRATVLSSQRVVPRRLEETGFSFKDPVLYPALRRLLTPA